MTAAARLDDNHLCPIPTHQVRKIIQASENVFINQKPAARIGDKTFCQQPNDNVITQGSATVFVNNKPIARVGDMLQHGGIITSGSNNVFIEQHKSIQNIPEKITATVKNVHKKPNPKDIFELEKKIPKRIKTIPMEVKNALKDAMKLENMPENQYDSLLWIMALESSGRTNIRNPISSARGLFQLTKANYHLNPNGKNSFGNALEECQGGIRYIKQRYKTADQAVIFWRENAWY